MLVPDRTYVVKEPYFCMDMSCSSFVISLVKVVVYQPCNSGICLLTKMFVLGSQDK